MNADDAPSPQRCPNCGEPLTAEEMQSGQSCARCSKPAAHLGLLPGDKLQEDRGSNSLGEIGSWQPGSLEQRYRSTSYEHHLRDGSITGEVSASGDPPATTVPGDYAPPPRQPDSTEVTGQGSDPAPPDGPPSYGPSGLSGFNDGNRYGSSIAANPSGIYGANRPGDSSWTPLADQLPAPDRYDPDRPPWGLAESIGVWVFSFVAILVLPVIGILVWIGYQRAHGILISMTPEQLSHDPTLTFVAVVSEGVAHVLTIVLLWAVVTRFGKRPFWATLGWSWSGVSPFARYGLIAGGLVFCLIAEDVLSSIPSGLRVEALLGFGLFVLALYMAAYRFRPSMATWSKIGFVVGIVALTLVVDIILSKLLPESKGTDFEEMLNTSRAVRVLISVLAVCTAPLVEEGVYRGVVYSALRRVTGLAPSVLIVTFLFAGVHVPQYWGAWSGIAGITVLSLLLTLVRAKTKSILPCIAIHTLFNLINSVFIVLHKN
jgi:membrane protease YdiL (CAAX protease family)